jgi:type VI secretion system secreted protein VgrG
MAASYLSLRIDGEPLRDVILKHVSVSQELNHHWWCHVECRHTEDQRVSSLLDAAADALLDQQSTVKVEEWLGKPLQIVAVDQDLSESTLFHGFVLEVELEYELAGSYTALVQAVTNSYKMDVTPRHAYYTGKTLKDLAQQLAINAGLKSEINGPDGRTLNYVQWGESDFDFLRRVVDDYGCWMRPTPNGIEIYDSFQKGTQVQWRGETGEDGLVSFSVKGTLAPRSLNGSHYDPHEMKSRSYMNVSENAQFFESVTPLVDAVRQGSKDKLPSGYLQYRNRVVTLDEYERLLKKESVRSIGASIVGSGESRNSDLLPGNEIEIVGALDARGTYGVTQVVHSWDGTGYSNQFTCTPWKNYTDAHPPEMKPWYGAASARVVEHNDPKKMGRIKVQYFWQEEGPTHWARMLTPHAGADRGFMFMPEVGDEVMVGFEDGDPERPYVLGCLWNGVHQAPREEFWGGELETNDVKRIVTKSGHRIQLVDKDGKEAIVIATPRELKISLIESTNETGRSMITLHTENGDMFFSAPNGRIHFHSKFFSREAG